METPPPPKIARLSSVAPNREEENKLRLDLIRSQTEKLKEEHEAKIEVIRLEKDAALARLEIAHYEKEAALAKIEYFKRKLNSSNSSETFFSSHGQNVCGCNSYVQL
jgi:hypothetical protein